ncbi:segregation/condensation protein A [Aeribacillus pallidus]|jgi:segregation and condensation protein A|uniref:segregation/condensation protein A n=1 Tax=Aeribacillus pallidus TaxID=33936 RepID=UPI001DCC20DC|nr:segregation/condensation protein A [Bacillus sp. (in: firmicutes)]
MEYNVKLDAFEGPLDLLLHLINRFEIDIYDIPMAEITEQYLLYIRTMQELELDVASEYLVMAATLLAIKSKMLLPQHEEMNEELEDVVEEDPREELVERLIEYKKYKEAAKELKERERERGQIFTKPPSDLSDYSQEIEACGADLQVTVYDMLGAFHKLLRRKKLQKPLSTKIAREEISIEQRMDEIREKIISSNRAFYFEELFPSHEREHIVVTFLAILELMKRNEILVEQQTNFAEIVIMAKGGATTVGHH